VFRLLHGHVLDKLAELPDASIHCVVTSPPYFGLRDYKIPPVDWPAVEFIPMAGLPPVSVPAMRCVHGLEAELFNYVAHEVLIFREVRRVLRDDGTLWLNLGESMTSAAVKWGGSQGNLPCKQNTNRGSRRTPKVEMPTGLDHKNLMGVPWRVAFALQADGWYLRMDNIWHKPNPMPESVTDRPTKAHEYVYLLTKNRSYFYDAEAVKERVTGGAHAKVPGNVREPKGARAYANGDHRQRTKAGLLAYAKRKRAEAGSGIKNNDSMEDGITGYMVSNRNKRSVWTIATESFKGAHFATFPRALVLPCILAGTSARGCCAKCGAPWRRVIEQSPNPKDTYTGKYSAHYHRGVNLQRALIAGRAAGGDHDNPFTPKKTIGWQPTCECLGTLAREQVILPARMAKEDAGLWGADSNGDYLGQSIKNHPAGIQSASDVKRRIIKNATEDRVVTRTIYHSDTPLEAHPVVPCTVLDLFLGSGTTAAVALEHGRDCIGIEISTEYLTLIKDRANVAPVLALHNF
jgi:DNA modification methylase